VAQAYLGMALVEHEKRAYDRALLALDRALEESPRGAVAAEIQFLAGVSNVRVGEFVRAAEAFQAARFSEPSGKIAARALDWLTLIHSMRLRPAQGGSVEFTHDASFVPRLPAGEDLRGELGLAVSREGELLVADPRRGAVLEFAEDGALKRTEPFPGARYAVHDAFGRIVLASAADVRVGNESFPVARRSGNAVRRLEEIGGAWRDLSRKLLVLDLHEGELAQYGKDLSDPKPLVRDKEAGLRMKAMAAGPEERLYLLDEKGKTVLALVEDRPRAVVPAGQAPGFEEPVALAVSALGDLYIADAKGKSLHILSADGKRLARISPAQGSPAEFLEPAAVAVGPRGDIYVYDQRKKTILRFR
jgi:hypothetical protein